MIYFGKNLAYLRAKKGLTLEVMSDLIGFGRSQWNNYEKETSFPKFLDLIEISKYFDISETDLIHKNLEIDTPSTRVKMPKIEESQFDLQNKLILMQEKEIARLEKDLSEFRYNSQKEPVLYRTVGESAPELIKKETK
jgi:transcriptional regulator with XRE-family HTH domain